ncbi:MAG: hypothetical protein NTX13_04910 [Acidobacteria bacterium]|jgi:hypothetical protein|nr:hypothetical protein [Acidobacteriota bacterium]
MGNESGFRLAVLAVAASVGVIATGPSGGKPHLVASGLLAVLLLALAGWMRYRVAYVCILLFLVSGGTGRLMKTNAAVAALHEVVGPVLLSLLCFLAVRAWTGSDREVEDAGSPPLRSLARWAPPVILLQVFLGALYRHGFLGISLHVLGAMVAGALIMFAGISVMILPGVGLVLRRVSWALLSVTCLQFFFGIYAYLSRMAAEEAGLAAGVSHVAVSHIVTGGLTMGLSVVLSLLVNRYVRPSEAVAA